MRDKWEYLEIDMNEDINDYGKKGWELVNVVYSSWENERKGYSESATIGYFKRKL